MTPFYDEFGVTLYHGDARTVLRALPSASVNCCVTSPPYWGLRDYGVDGQLGLEPTPELYVQSMVEVFREVRRVLRDDGVLWLNLGDSYNNAGSSRNGEGLDGTRRGGATGEDGALGYKKRDPRHALRSHGIKHKDLIGIPWAVAFALRADGWYLRQDIIWHKPNPMPESVTDRCTKAHEYIFLMSKSPRYYYDADAIAEPAIEGTDLGLLRGRSFADGENIAWHAPSIQRRQAEGVDSRTAGNGKRNRRSVWPVTTQPYAEAHFATFPPDLIQPCIRAGCPDDGTVLDPFFGAGTTGVVARNQHVNCIGIELNAEYCALCTKRLAQGVLPFATAGGAA